MVVLFNTQNSLDDLGLIIEQNPDIPVPQKNVNTIEIEGRDGSLTEDLGTYKDIEIPVDFALADENIKPKCRQIKKWLAGNILDNKLIFDDDLDYYYKVKNVRISNNITRILELIGRFTAIFVCEPFSYSVDNFDITITQPTSISEENAYIGKPVITVYGQGDIELSINSNHILLTDIEDYITIDTEMLNAYKDTQPQGDKMDGYFPIFDQLQNNINWTGNVTKIIITPNWRYL